MSLKCLSLPEQGIVPCYNLDLPKGFGFFSLIVKKLNTSQSEGAHIVFGNQVNYTQEYLLEWEVRCRDGETGEKL